MCSSGFRTALMCTLIYLLGVVYVRCLLYCTYKKGMHFKTRKCILFRATVRTGTAHIIMPGNLQLETNTTVFVLRTYVHTFREKRKRKNRLTYVYCSWYVQILLSGKYFCPGYRGLVLFTYNRLASLFSLSK